MFDVSTRCTQSAGGFVVSADATAADKTRTLNRFPGHNSRGLFTFARMLPDLSPLSLLSLSGEPKRHDSFADEREREVGSTTQHVNVRSAAASRRGNRKPTDGRNTEGSLNARGGIHHSKKTTTCPGIGGNFPPTPEILSHFSTTLCKVNILSA